ncbi:DUF397 domain-containing protein [Saccharopolyspora pogona]|uniref:DUF397 domain-containing protein n=1 Tax=Saccharopolyspora pogona TaxID=333966 RepID=UPI00168685DF|nr:DUF397 domain-containing protein [Saccharopolyspora pogona]
MTSTLGVTARAARVWRRSSYSTATGNCVEVAAGDGVVAARDSKDPDGPVLVFSRARWAAVLPGWTEQVR